MPPVIRASGNLDFAYSMTGRPRIVHKVTVLSLSGEAKRKRSAGKHGADNEQNVSV